VNDIIGLRQQPGPRGNPIASSRDEGASGRRQVPHVYHLPELVDCPIQVARQIRPACLIWS